MSATRASRSSIATWQTFIGWNEISTAYNHRTYRCPNGIEGLRLGCLLDLLDAKPGELTPELVKNYLDVKARRLL